MKPRSNWSFLLAAFLLAGAVHADATLEGRWLLVSETLGGASNNRVHSADAMHLEFDRKGSAIEGRAWFGNARASVAPWPAFAYADAAEFTIESIAFTDDESAVRAVYSMRQAEPNAEIKVIESYRLVDGGAAMTGSVTLSSGGKEIYQLHRRFERQR